MSDECETAFDKWRTTGTNWVLIDRYVNAKEIWKAAWLEATKQIEDK